MYICLCLRCTTFIFFLLILFPFLFVLLPASPRALPRNLSMYFSSHLPSRPDPFHRSYVLSNTFIILQCNIRSAHGYEASTDNVHASDSPGERLHTQPPLPLPSTSPLKRVCLCTVSPQSPVFVHDLPFSDCIESYALLVFCPFLPLSL